MTLDITVFQAAKIPKGLFQFHPFTKLQNQEQPAKIRGFNPYLIFEIGVISFTLKVWLFFLLEPHLSEVRDTFSF